MDNKKTININIVDALRLMRKDRKWMTIYILIGIVFGIVVAFSIPKEYKTTVILAPEETSSGFTGSISSLASMVGMDVNIGESGDAIYPEIYPDVMSSTDFLVSLFSIKVTTKDKNYTSDYATYLKTQTKSPWWEYPKVLLAKTINNIKGDNATFQTGKKVDPFNLTKPEWELTQTISHNIDCTVDKKTNVITISVEDQDPKISACIADTIKTRLQALITDYRTKKARNDVEYLEKICHEAKMQYDKTQNVYSAYTDAHKNAILETVNQEGDKLQSEMQLRENIYNTVAQQLQLAKAKVQEKTPAFTTIQNASTPVKPINKPKILVVTIWIIIAFLVRSLVICWKNKDKFLISSPTK